MPNVHLLQVITGEMSLVRKSLIPTHCSKAKVHTPGGLRIRDALSLCGMPVEDFELGYAYNEIGIVFGYNSMLGEAENTSRRSIEIFRSLHDYHDTMLG